MRRRVIITLCSAFVSMLACEAPEKPIRTLTPDPNPLPSGDPLSTPQPHRERPRQVCAHEDTAWVTLPGTEDAPGDAVAIVDLSGGRVRKKLHVPGAPWGCAVDPAGRYVVLTLRYSDHALVLDATTDEIVARVPVPYYTESVLFSMDAHRVYLTNRWKDAVLSWDIDLSSGFEVVRTNYDGVPAYEAMGTPVGDNPGPMALSSDGKRLFVGSVAGLTVAVLDARTLDLVDVDSNPSTTTRGAPAGISHIDHHSPVGGLAVSGRWLIVADIGRGTGSKAEDGLDLDEDGLPGDGTANVVFQDLQNELAVIDTAGFTTRNRYTSDSICCRDFRDVDPERPDRGLTLPSPDTWRPEVLDHLPAKETWIVAGSLPEAMVVEPGRGTSDTLWVAFAGSNEIQRFRVEEKGSLTPLDVAGELVETGYNPKSLAYASGGADRVIVTHRLGETIGIHDVAAPKTEATTVVVGDVTSGRFPATDAELGEGINEMTAAFTIDGDQTCVHCHRENGAIGRPIVMPLQADRAHGARNVMAQRGLFDTRPWFFESAMGERNFFPVLNEFARRENFCCEQLDPMIWQALPTYETCAGAPQTEGCLHVLECEVHPPVECLERPYGGGGHLLRSDFVREAARRLFGRDTAIGDVLSEVDLDGHRRPIPLDFDGMTRAIGLFMLRTPRLLPNPNRALDLPTAARGGSLFQQPAVGCAGCHPLPRTTTAVVGDTFSPAGLPIRFPPVITPERGPQQNDASRVTAGFLQTFPETVQGPEGLHFGATPLRGLWDRPRDRFFHDGRARSLREALSSPGHPALAPGESGHNVRDGVVDTHGGTSHLDRYQMEDLLNFVLTL